MSRSKFCALVAIVLLSGWATAAQAQQSYGACCDGYGAYGGAYQMYGMENIPYFSLHPPVYYSYPVPRPYGYSPFAYPPGTMTPEIVQPTAPKEIINPHVPQPNVPKDKAKPTSNKTAVAPVLIVNPFVGSVAGPAVVKASVAAE